MKNMPVCMPLCLSCPTAARTCATVTPRSMASSRRCEPQLLGMVAVENPLHLIHYGQRASPPVGFSKRGMAAPAAMIRAAPRGDDGYRSGAVAFPPGAQVLAD